jgi:hypothetical protein
VNRLLFSLAACGALLCATIADAQPPGQGRGRGGPGGFSFGGGFGGPQGKLDLVTREPVQKDMALKEDQVAKVRELEEQVRDERRAAFQGGAGGNPFDQNLSAEERQKRQAEFQARLEESRKKVNDKFLPLLSEILTEEQETRLQQIVWQAAGEQALLDKEVQEKLKLSKEQQDKLASLNKEAADKLAELRPQFGRGGPGGQGGQGNFQETIAKRNEITEARKKDMEAVLSADQKAEYAKAKGKEFDVAQLNRFGGRGGPGGGQPGAGGRPPGGGRPGGEGGRPGGAEGRPGGGRPQPNAQQ